MTNREFINSLSDEEFAQCLIDDVIIHMACECSITTEGPACPMYPQDCLVCLVKFLKSEVEK